VRTYYLTSLKVYVKRREEMIQIHPNSENTIYPNLYLFNLKTTPNQKQCFASFKKNMHNKLFKQNLS